ncbi:MAG: cyclic nucleotide-binding domain-containing protein [Betaproteobacteria bacterium]|nr:cyclic nucleotide-binding domain-containing protein [Betaproteobacteria bacterium]
MLNFFHRRQSSERLRELEQLSRLSLFVGLTHGEMKIVDGFVHERTFLKDEVIFDEGDDGEAIYIIFDGTVTICRQGQSEQPIALLERGSFFGELALLDDAPRMAQARAAENCTLIVLFRGDFLNLMQAHALIASKIALQLARHLGQRLRVAVRGEQAAL